MSSLHAAARLALCRGLLQSNNEYDQNGLKLQPGLRTCVTPAICMQCSLKRICA